MIYVHVETMFTIIAQDLYYGLFHIPTLINKKPSEHLYNVAYVRHKRQYISFLRLS